MASLRYLFTPTLTLPLRERGKYPHPGAAATALVSEWAI